MSHYKYRILLALLAIMVLLNTNNLFAQSSELFSQKITILIKAEDAQQYEKTVKEGIDAAAFDINQYLKENLKGNQIEIHGRFVSEQEHITYRFKSSELPSDLECLNFCEKLVKLEQKPFLGVATTPTNDFIGVNISRIVDASAAESVDLTSGDIITAVNDEAIGSNCDLTIAINNYMPGEIIDIEYARSGKTETIPATLGYRVKKEITWVPCCEEEMAENTFDVAIENKGNIQLDIYPNPNDGIFSLQFNSSDLSDTEIYISDATGRIIYRNTLSNFDGYYNKNIDISKEASGLYFLNVIQNDKVITKKIVLQKQ